MTFVVDRIDHVVLNCRDVDATADWYVRVLGMRREVFGEGRVALVFGNQKINVRPSGAQNWETGAVDAPGSLGPMTSHYCRDPDGNLIEVASYSARVNLHGMTASRFSTDVYSQRLRAAAAATADAGLAGLVITPGYDLRYLVGSRAQTFERLTALVLPATGEPTMVVPRLELASLKESAVTELGLAVRDWVDGNDPYRVVADALGGAPAATAVTDSMPALHLLPLADVLGVVPVLATDVLRRLRMIKDAAEIDALRKAGAAIDRVHARVPEFLVPGRTEADVAADIAESIVAEGHSEVAFIIVGSGPHGADPHHECSDRELRAGDIVVVDIGGPYEPGYNSDSTRTYSIGEPDPEVARRYAVLQRAQQAAVEAVRPGVTAEQVDAVARDVLAAEGLADAFVHRTGHGIGLSVHEEPYIVAGNALLLEAGMAFSVEPGIYFPGQWGARIEDIVVVTADGALPVNNRPHELVVVPAGPGAVG